MKSLLLTFPLLFSLSALADCQREAQFIGTARDVKDVVAANGEVVTAFRIKLAGWFQPSMVCPMHEDELESAVVELDYLSSLNEGDSVSGVLLFDEAQGRYRLE